MSQVGVVVPTLGERPESLRATLLSLHNQNPRPFIVIVRPESARQIDRDFRNLFDMVVLDSGTGLSGAINLGLAALPESVTFGNWLGDDDELTQGSLKSALQGLESNPSAVLAYGDCEYVNEDGKTFKTLRPGLKAARTVYFFPNRIPQPGALFRLEAFKQVGGVNPDLRFAMDLDLWFKLLKLGRAIYISKTVAKYKWHAGSLSAANQIKAFNESRYLRQKYSTGFVKYLARAVDALSSLILKTNVSTLDRLASKSKSIN